MVICEKEEAELDSGASARTDAQPEQLKIMDTATDEYRGSIDSAIRTRTAIRRVQRWNEDRLAGRTIPVRGGTRRLRPQHNFATADRARSVGARAKTRIADEPPVGEECGTGGRATAVSKRVPDHLRSTCLHRGEIRLNTDANIAR